MNNPDIQPLTEAIFRVARSAADSQAQILQATSGWSPRRGNVAATAKRRAKNRQARKSRRANRA